MSEILTWEDFPRKKDTIAILGFSINTRDMTPWNDPNVEIFSLNEGYNFPWVKRWDRWFQIHPRWDFIRNTNNNDPNHFLWLTNREGPCVQCKGGGSVVPLMGKDKTARECPACNGTGHYIPPESRKDNFPIYMQKHYDDIPNSVAYPLNSVIDCLIPKLNIQQDYFTSSFALMFGLAYMMGYKRIELYGFEMGAQTEYHYQRSNAEYLMGLVQTKGIEVYIPKESSLLTGPLYAYKNMKQGYRQNLEMRKGFLEGQLGEEQAKLNVMSGELSMLKQLPKNASVDDIKALIANKESDIKQGLGLINGLRFALEETKNLTGMYDNYFWMGTEEGEIEIDRPTSEITNHVTLAYRTDNHA